MVRKALIKKIMASRILVELDDGTDAWLPGQELSSLYDPSAELSKQDLCRTGQQIEVIVYENAVGGKQKLVSHVRVKNDPWERVRRWKDNELKEMEIHSITPNRAFGRIEPGIEGFVDLTDLYEQIHFKASWDGFRMILPGDRVAGYINLSAASFEDRLIKVDVATYIQHLKDISQCLEVGSYDVMTNLRTGVQEELPFQQLEVSGVRRIILVDDETVFINDLRTEFEKFGIIVGSFHSEEDFKRSLDGTDVSDNVPDCAFVDLHLSLQQPYTGLNVVKALEEQYPECRIFLTTADQESLFIPESRNEILAVAGDAKISGIVYKPLGTAELRSALSRALAQEPKALKYFVNGDGYQESAPRNAQLEDRHSLKFVLQDLRRETQATAVVLFSIHPVTNEVSVVEKSTEQVGYLSDLDGPLRRMLCYSPVKDVALKNETIFERKISGTTKQQKHRYLHKAVKYESCIAFPVSVPSELAYCLFAFHKRAGQFTHNSDYRIKSCAGEIGRILEMRRLIDIRREDERYLITGKSYGKLAHDLRTNLPTEFSLARLAKLLDEISQPNDRTISELQTELSSALVTWRRVLDVVNTFHRMFMHRQKLDYEEPVNPIDVNPVVAEVISYLQAQARYSYHSEFRVRTSPIEPHPLIRIRRAALEQVLVNLMMNAVQQIERFSFVRGNGLVEIEISQIDEEEAIWLQMLLHDSGPGIHRRDFDRVFEIGFTTTENGLGMGLDICRDIISEADGKISIKKSVLFVGTTFEILLPLSTSTRK